MKKDFLSLLPLYLVVFSAFFDTHAQMPVLTPYALTMGATPFMLGLVFGAYSLFNIAGNFTGGATIDHKGWKIPLLWGLFSVSSILLLYTQANNAYQLIAIRAAHGFMGGFLIPAALACLTLDEGSKPLQGQRLAFFGMAIGLAAVVGPLFSGFIASRFNYEAVYLGLALLMFAAAFSAILFTRNNSCRIDRHELISISFKQIALDRRIRGAFIFAFGTMGSTGTLATFLPVLAGDSGLSPAQTGMLFATFALVAMVVQYIWPLAIKPVLLHSYRGCTIGLIFLALAMILTASLKNSPALFCGLALYGIGFGLSFQGMLGLVIEGSKPAWRGRAIGLFFAVYSLGVALVPPLSGLIWQYFLILFPFYTAALISLLCAMAGHIISGGKKREAIKNLSWLSS